MTAIRRKTARVGKRPTKARTRKKTPSKRAKPVQSKKSVAPSSSRSRKAGKRMSKLPAVRTALSLRFREGCAGAIHIVERFGTGVDQVSQTCQINLAWIENRDPSKESRGPSNRSGRTKRTGGGHLWFPPEHGEPWRPQAMRYG